MPRPDRSAERRLELAPVVARAFAELGYRRATTAELAARCGVQEPALYRLWPDKRAMFVAALDHVFRTSESTWAALLARSGERRSSAELLLEYEAAHHGELGLYRIVFAGLSETDDPRIAAALKRLYRRFHAFVRSQVEAHRLAGGEGSAVRRSGSAALAAEQAAWAIVGLGTVANVVRELGLLPARARERLIAEVGRRLLEAGAQR